MSTNTSVLTVMVLIASVSAPQADETDTEPSLPPVYLSIESATLYLGQDRDEVVAELGEPGVITTSERPLGAYNTERFDDGTRIGYYSFNRRVAYLDTTNPKVSTILDVQVGDWVDDVMKRFPSLRRVGEFIVHPVHLIPKAPEDPLSIHLVLIIEDERIIGMALSHPVN